MSITEQNAHLFQRQFVKRANDPIDLFIASATDRDIRINTKILYSLILSYLSYQSSLVRSCLSCQNFRLRNDRIMHDGDHAADWKYKDVVVDRIIKVININDNQRSQIEY